MIPTSNPVAVAPVKHMPSPVASVRDAAPALEPMPWPGMSKAECVLMAILLHRVTRAREVGR